MDNSARAQLCADLDDAGRRRLWIVELVLERTGHQNPADALELAFRFERFINEGLGRCDDEAAEHRDDAPASPAGLDAACEPHSAPAPGISAEPRGSNAPQSPSRGRIPLLPSEAREQFAAMAATGVDNRVLAGRFRLSVRQAHAIRLSLARQRPEVRPARLNGKSTPSAPQLSREEEQRLEQKFLRERRPTPSTIDDVIRFLRQRGDSVVSREGGYLVNERLLLSGELLVARANRQRKHMGAPMFDLGNGDVSSCDGAAPAYVMTGVMTG